MTLEEEIKSCYQRIIERKPDEKSLRHYEARIKNNDMTLKDLEKILKNSGAFKILNKQKPFLKFAPNFKSKFSDYEIQKLIGSVPVWHQTIKLGNVSTPGKSPLAQRMWLAQGIPLDLTGKSVLDIGANEGFFSFLCEARGASRVLAIDSEQFDELREKNKKLGSSGFEVCKKILNSNVEYRRMNLFDIDELDEIFDYVLFFGVYYHLDNPVRAFQKIFPQVKNSLYFSGNIFDSKEPLMYFLDESVLDNDPTNWWVASPSCILKIGKRIGFKNAEIIDEMYPYRQNDHSTLDNIELQKRRGFGIFKFS